MSDHRYFDPNPTIRALAYELYAPIAGLPLVCPHGHVDPRLFADPDYQFGSPVDLLIIPDHYVFRMLYSQGIRLEQLGIARLDGGVVESDHRAIWQLFADHIHLFRATPTGLWLRDELRDIFGIEQKLTSANAQQIYDQIAEKLATPAFRPRALYQRFNIEVLCTTDAATDTLAQHAAIRQSGWSGRILPTFRPDGVVNIDMPGWRTNIDLLSQVSGIEVRDYASYLAALEQRRAFFKQIGAMATDHAARTPFTAALSTHAADAILQRALRGSAEAHDATRFTAHMLIEFARMSAEDGLVMQLHPGSFRNHNQRLAEQFGADKGADIPQAVDYTSGLKALLDAWGNDPRLTLILFTLDETTYGRELAPLVGHYPSLRLGPPWWFFDSLNGMARYFDQVVETAGIANTAGFNDDTRAYCSIPARHDLWRRAAANWLAGLVARSVIDIDDAHAMAHQIAYAQARQVYHLG